MPNLSHTTLECWEACPCRYRLQYVERRSRGAGVNAMLLAGRALHRVLAEDGIARRDGRDPLTPERLHDRFTMLLVDEAARATRELERAGQDIDLVDVALVEEAQRRGRAALEVYTRHVAPRLKPIDVERKLEVELPTPEAPPGWRFKGFLDARTTPSNGGTAIVDYKFTSSGWKKGRELTDNQATAYLWLERAAGLPPSQRCVFLVFTIRHDGRTWLDRETGEVGPWRFTAQVEWRIATRDADDLEEYELLMREVAHEIEAAAKSGDYEARSGRQCLWCDVREYCDEGSAWAAANAAPPPPDALPW